MYIRDIYYNDTESLYSVILDEDEMRLYTQYDMTDQLKGAKDSDILAEKKRSNLGSYLGAGKAAAAGAVAGGTIGAIGAGIAAKKAGVGLGGALRRAGKASPMGAVAGAGLAGLAALAAGHKQRQDNRFYNKRLGYAQTQARRRESKDWSNNMTNRTDYTY